MGLKYNILKGLIKNKPKILVGIASLGVIGTGILSAVQTPKVLNMLKAEKEKTQRDLKPIERIKIMGFGYSPAIFCGGFSILCMLLGEKELQKKLTGVIMSYSLLHNKYKESVALNGESDVHDVMCKKYYTDISEDTVASIDGDDNLTLFYDSTAFRYFTRTLDEVLAAEMELNRTFILRGYVSLNVFYNYLDLPITEEGDVLGWGIEVGEALYGYSWIDFDHKKTKMEDGMECTIISFPFAPTPDYLE